MTSRERKYHKYKRRSDAWCMGLINYIMSKEIPTHKEGLFSLSDVEDIINQFKNNASDKIYKR